VDAPVSIRHAERRDAADVQRVVERAIRRSAVVEYRAAQIDAWASGGTEDGAADMIDRTVAFVAESDGRVVGFSNLDRDDVDQMYVDPDFEGRGVARRLYDAVEAEARARGVTELTVTASLRAVAAFRAFSFAAEQERDRSYNGETFRVFGMTKVLDGIE
jgi:putative acetyltransferase